MTPAERGALKAAKVEPLKWRRGIHCRPGRWWANGTSHASRTIGRLHKRGLLACETVRGERHFVLTDQGKFAV